MRKSDKKTRVGSWARRTLYAGDDRLRHSWRLYLCLVIYAAVRLAVQWGLTEAFSALFHGWGVDASNAHRAPAWARLIYVWHGSGITALGSAAVIALSVLLRRHWVRPVSSAEIKKDRSLYLATPIGLGLILVAGVVFLALDSMRLEWPLSEPRFGPSTVALVLLSLLSVAADEAFGKGVLYDLVRGDWGGFWATACAGLLFFLRNGGYSAGWLCAVNVALLAVLSCEIYRIYGMRTLVCFRWGWSVAMSLLLGFGGGSHAVYRLYHVSDAWLTGGNVGPIAGAWMTLALLACVLWIWRKTVINNMRALRTRIKPLTKARQRSLYCKRGVEPKGKTRKTYNIQ